jgi:hypothetical protein
MSVEERSEALPNSTFPPLFPTASCTRRSVLHVGGLAVGTQPASYVHFSGDAEMSFEGGDPELKRFRAGAKPSMVDPGMELSQGRRG